MRRAFIGLLFLSGGFAHGAAPPLGPNEEIVRTADVCGVVMRTHPDCAVCNETSRKHYAALAWGGACIDGLAMGEGLWSARAALAGGVYREPTRGWAWYGKGFGWTENRWTNGGISRAFSWEGKTVHFNGLEPAQGPRWDSGPGLGSSLGDGETHVWTVDPARIGVSRGSQREFYDCPGYPKSKGCEALWAQHAGPVIERIKAFIAENEPKARARQQQAEILVAEWRKNVGSGLVARGAAIAQTLNDQATQETERDARCIDRELAAHRVNDQSKAEYPEQAERLGNALKQAFSGECASHPNAAKALQFADEELARGRQVRRDNEQRRQREAEERGQSRQEELRAALEVVTAFQTTKNALEQQATEAQAQAHADARARAQAQQASTGSAQARPPAAQSANQKQVGSGQQPAEPWKSPEDRRREAAREQVLRERDQQFEASAARTAAVPHCLQLASTTSYGGFRNTCGFKVDFVYCTLGSTGEGLTNFSDGCDCRGKLLCSSVVKPYSETAGLTSGAKQVIWGACKEPYTALQRGFNGREILYECRK